MDNEYTNVSKEVLEIEDMFDHLENEKKLELFGILLEKLENREVVLKGKPVSPEEIGIDDAFACCAAILDMVDPILV